MTADTLQEIAPALNQKDNKFEDMKELRLRTNNLTESGDHLPDIMKHFTSLQILDLLNCQMVDADIKKLDPAENLNNLKRLRILEVLSLPHSKMSNVQELCIFYPDCQLHSNIWMFVGTIMVDILEITKVKKQLPNLQRLNIGSMSDKDDEHIAIPDYEEYMTTVREELQQDNSEIKVYCDDEEEVWYMYR